MPNRDQYVLIIGSSNMDLNIYSQRFPKPGETVTGGVFKQFLGGKGANQAVASVRSGSKTIFIGKVGMDAFGNDMLSQLGNEGVNIEHIIRDPHESSGVAFILIDESGENMISVAPGANFKLTPDEVQVYSDVIKDAKCLIVQMEIPIETIEEIFKIASQGEVIKILNPAPLKPIRSSILSKIDIIIPNEGELSQLHSLLKLNELVGNNKDKIIQASKNISKFGIKTIITTLGKNGCILYEAEEDRITEIPAIKVQAIDTVGAGDCFNGVVASKLCQGENILTSIKYATTAASIAITRKGAQASMPYANEIEDRYKHYKANYSFG
ncbi:MAG: ribokinase [Candidatus Lokiarchaeota archaeon]|nr:ribokinase [Candidatus Lokiarchaeota archaeon]